MGTMKIGHTNWCRKCLAALFIGPGTSLRISCSEDGEAVKLSKLSKEWLGTVALLLVERISCPEDNTACNTSTDSVLWSRPLVDLSYKESSFLYLAWDWSYCIPSSRGLDIVVGFLLISWFFFNNACHIAAFLLMSCGTHLKRQLFWIGPMPRTIVMIANAWHFYATSFTNLVHF